MSEESGVVFDKMIKESHGCMENFSVHPWQIKATINLTQYHKLVSKDFTLKKRQDYISWDEYFMGVALLSAKRSKDPSTQVGACIVSDKNKIVGAGYNGFPIGCDDDEFPWDKQGDFLNTKYPYVCH